MDGVNDSEGIELVSVEGCDDTDGVKLGLNEGTNEGKSEGLEVILIVGLGV